jgi:hypothetical protein
MVRPCGASVARHASTQAHQTQVRPYDHGGMGRAEPIGTRTERAEDEQATAGGELRGRRRDEVLEKLEVGHARSFARSTS